MICWGFGLNLPKNLPQPQVSVFLGRLLYYTMFSIHLSFKVEYYMLVIGDTWQVTCDRGHICFPFFWVLLSAHFERFNVSCVIFFLKVCLQLWLKVPNRYNIMNTQKTLTISNRSQGLIKLIKFIWPKQHNVVDSLELQVNMGASSSSCQNSACTGITKCAGAAALMTVQWNGITGAALAPSRYQPYRLAGGQASSSVLKLRMETQWLFLFCIVRWCFIFINL